MIRTLNGLEYVSASFGSFITKKLYDLTFKPSEGEFDVWLCPAAKSDSGEYYEYVKLYVHDIMTASYNTIQLMKDLGKWTQLKS